MEVLIVARPNVQKPLKRVEFLPIWGPETGCPIIISFSTGGVPLRSKIQSIVVSFSLAFFFLMSHTACSSAEPWNSQEEKAIRDILTQVQSVHEFFMSHNREKTSLSGIINSMDAASSVSESLKKELDPLRQVLEKAQKSSDSKTFFQTYSEFSVMMDTLMKKHSFQTDFHRFYCPMEKKSWLSRGMEIQNPYAPDMRNCGGIVE